MQKHQCETCSLIPEPFPPPFFVCFHASMQNGKGRPARSETSSRHRVDTLGVVPDCKYTKAHTHSLISPQKPFDSSTVFSKSHLTWMQGKNLCHHSPCVYLLFIWRHTLPDLPGLTLHAALAYRKQSKTGGGCGLGARLHWVSQTAIYSPPITDTPNRDCTNFPPFKTLNKMLSNYLLAATMSHGAHCFLCNTAFVF